MRNKQQTSLQIPSDLEDTKQLRDFLTRLVELVDILNGNRGDKKALPKKLANDATLSDTIIAFNGLIDFLSVETE